MNNKRKREFSRWIWSINKEAKLTHLLDQSRICCKSCCSKCGGRNEKTKTGEETGIPSYNICIVNKYCRERRQRETTSHQKKKRKIKKQKKAKTHYSKMQMPLVSINLCCLLRYASFLSLLALSASLLVFFLRIYIYTS